MTTCGWCGKLLAGEHTAGIAFCDDACVFIYAMRLDFTRPPVSEISTGSICPEACSLSAGEMIRLALIRQERTPKKGQSDA